MATAPRSTFIGLVVLAAVSLFANAALWWRYVNRPPYVLVMHPADRGASVQFIQPQGLGGRASVSPMFRIDVQLKEPFVATLDSASIAIPGAVVEHGDTTLKPGAFDIRFGDDAIQVMESRIHLNGRDFEWTEANGDAVEFIDLQQQVE